MFYIAYVAVPKDLAKVRSKLIFNLTPRQIICFWSAAIVGLPVYFLTRSTLGNSIAAMLMVVIVLPFFFLAMYEKDGLPFEKVVWNMVQAKYLYPVERPYQTQNLYEMMENDAFTQEVSFCADKTHICR